MVDTETVLAVLDEIEGVRPNEPDASLYIRVETPVTLEDGQRGTRLGLFLQRAARPRASASNRATTSST